MVAAAEAALLAAMEAAEESLCLSRKPHNFGVSSTYVVKVDAPTGADAPARGEGDL